MSWYFALLVCGLFLVGVEIFIPGGIVGAAGAAALIGAAAMGFMIFPPWLGWLSLLLILTLTALAVFLWMKYFPKSPMGKSLSLTQYISKRDQDESTWKSGMKGIALSNLRPAGKVLIEGVRADVVADGTWIEQNAPIEIIKVEGNRICVREVKLET